MAASTADGITPVVLEADPSTHLLQVSSSGGSGGTQYTDGAAAVAHPIGTQPVFTNGSNVVTAVSTANPLPITGSISVGSTTDSTAFTAGSSTTAPSAGVYNDGLTALSSGIQGTYRSTAYRAQHINLRNNSGTEIGTSSTPIQVSLANTATNSTAVKVDGSAVTQPVSASSLPLPTGASTSAKQPALGTAGTASSDVLTVQGITSMTPLKTDGSGTTQPVSGSVTANAGTNLNTSALALETGGNLATIVTNTTGVAKDSSLTTIDTDLKSNITLHAGTNIIGKVGIDQTTPGTTNAVVATAGDLTSGSQLTKITNGTNTADVVAGDTGFNGVAVASATKTITFTTSSSGVQTLLANTNVEGYSWIEIVYTSVGVGLALTGQFSTASGGTYVNSSTFSRSDNSTNSNTALGTTANVIYYGPIHGNYFQLVVSALTSGTFAGTVTLRVIPPPITNLFTTSQQQGTWNVGTISAAINVGQQTSNTSAVQLSSTSTVPTNGIVVEALVGNAAVVYIGGSGVTTSSGFQLSAGQSVSLTCNLNTIYVIGSNNTDKVCWSVE